MKWQRWRWRQLLYLYPKQCVANSVMRQYPRTKRFPHSAVMSMTVIIVKLEISLWILQLNAFFALYFTLQMCECACFGRSMSGQAFESDPCMYAYLWVFIRLQKHFDFDDEPHSRVLVCTHAITSHNKLWKNPFGSIVCWLLSIYGMQWNIV